MTGKGREGWGGRSNKRTASRTRRHMKAVVSHTISGAIQQFRRIRVGRERSEHFGEERGVVAAAGFEEEFTGGGALGFEVSWCVEVEVEVDEGEVRRRSC